MSRFRPGSLVQVRSAKEIFETLDESGALDGLPFMPEMLSHCGAVLRVESSAHKTCDTINYSGSRRLADTVHLSGTRCDGAAHGGCQAGCLFFWKHQWLKPIRGGESVDSELESEVDGEVVAFLKSNASHQDESEGVRYRCQATDLLKASSPIQWWDPLQYIRDVQSGNVGIGQVVKSASFRIFDKWLKSIGPYNRLLQYYNRFQKKRGGTPYPYLTGKLKKTPRETLDLEPGEWVRIKSQEEILETVDLWRRNRGLSFDPEMVRYCGSTRQVLARVERIVDEKNGQLIELPSDCIILGDVTCKAEYSSRRLFCPRALYPFWREIWLDRLHDEQQEDIKREIEGRDIT